MPTVHPLKTSINFNAQHSPVGAFMSFTCGHFGSRGGIGVQIGKPANQDIFIGVKQGDRYSDAPIMCLPFYEGATTGKNVGLDEAAQAYLVEQGAAQKITGKPMLAYGAKDIRRHYGWASDRWVTPEFEFAIYSPFLAAADHTRDPASCVQGSQLPAVFGELTIDNRKGKNAKTAVFALGFQDGGVHLLDNHFRYVDGSGSTRGFAFRGQLGVAGHVVDEAGEPLIGKDDPAFTIMRWSPHEALRDRDNPVHLLGNTPGIAFEVAPGQFRTLRIAIASFLKGDVTTGLVSRYSYTHGFTDLASVLDYTLDSFSIKRFIAEQTDCELLESGLTPDQQFLIAHATRSYYGSTQLLDVGGQPYWNVNEGEYCMMNTLDLAVDHVFWELKQNPWVVRNLLDNFVRFYSYHDQVKDPVTGKMHPGGISFAHDQGIHNNFSPLGRSSYELSGLHGCFSHMTQEQLCNWTLCAADYAACTGDSAWLASQTPTIAACYASMLQRDHPDPRKRNGIMDFDSSRCGPNKRHGNLPGSQEITTYDSIDASLGQARNNLYLAVKCWATYLGLSMMFDKLGRSDDAKKALDSAKLAAKTIAAQMRPDGFLPAVFEKDSKGYDARILPAIECVVHVWYWSTQSATTAAQKAAKSWLAERGPFAALHTALKKHTLTLLLDPLRRNHFPDGSLKISSTSNNSWQSKLAIVQQVARRVYHLDRDKRIAKVFAEADKAQVGWQLAEGSAYWAMSDQLLNGVALGSKYYPRGITTALWME